MRMRGRDVQGGGEKKRKPSAIRGYCHEGRVLLTLTKCGAMCRTDAAEYDPPLCTHENTVTALRGPVVTRKFGTPRPLESLPTTTDGEIVCAWAFNMKSAPY